MKTELYINNQLCDLGSSDLSIRFKRMFFNPAELNTKDAQKSYSITLPVTAQNNEIFGFTNIEEIREKFVKIYDAFVIVGSVKIFDGKFRMSEIGKNYYTGNLGIPAPITAKDIFGEKKMNETGDWYIPFNGIPDITTYNNKENPEAIFPLVMYGLLPKQVDDVGQFLPNKDRFDGSVRLGLDNFPPSVNVIQMLQQIFDQSGYNLSGTAIDDKRLKNLYVSYRNPDDYELQWNVGAMQIKGSWKTFLEEKGEDRIKISNNIGNRGIIDFFDSSNNVIDRITDNGGYIRRENDRMSFNVPTTGLYKLRFLTVYRTPDKTGSAPRYDISSGVLSEFHTEIKILRNFDGDFDNIIFDNSFYKDNLNQKPGDSNAIFPQKGAVNFIDPKQNKNIISGFSFGSYNSTNYINPLDPDDGCNPMAIKGGKSWSAGTADGVNELSYSAVRNLGYAKADGISTNRFKVELDNSITYAQKNNDREANGEINQVVWLERGDRIDIIGVSSTNSSKAVYNYEIDYDLTLEPFTPEINWLKMYSDGSSITPMDWNDPIAFRIGEIDLIKFLPSEIKVDEWIDNFCNAFNLRLENKGAKGFELNIKNAELVRQTSSIINLDQKANVNFRTNQSLGIPYMYDIGFTIDTNEEGYSLHGTAGGGQFHTGSINTNTIRQTCSFSYNWFMQLYDYINNEFAKVPIVADHEIFEKENDYAEMMSKTYFDKAQRFWYKAGIKNINLTPDTSADVALVKNEYSGNRSLILDYEDKPNSITRSFFLLIMDDNNYTSIDCYLTPDEYNRLPYSLVKFNGDIYRPIEIDGYDPTGKNKGTIKLIKRIV